MTQKRTNEIDARIRAILLIILTSPAAYATCSSPASIPALDPNTSLALVTIENQLITIGRPLAILMLIYMGVKWLIAEGPEDRDNARRGVIYVVIGIIMLIAAESFVQYLLC